MSLLIRKTKKCCAKLLRKLQISNNQQTSKHHTPNNSGVPNNRQHANNNNNQQTSKNAKLAKNNNNAQKRTNHPVVSGSDLNNHHRRSCFNPHSDSFVYQQYDSNNAQNTSVFDQSSGHRLSPDSYFFEADDEHDHTINTTQFNGLVTDDRQQHRQPSKRRVRSKRSPIAIAEHLLSETQLPREQKPRRTPAAIVSAAAHRLTEDTIIFTDNQIYVALEPLVQENSTESTDDPAPYSNHLNNMSATRNKLTDKCPFHISSQLQEQQRRTAYANNQHNLTSAGTATTNGSEHTTTAELFEKVKFDPSKRYLQHPSPSIASTGSGKVAADCHIPSASSYEAFLFDQCTQARTSSMYVDDQLLDSTFVQYWPFGREPVTVAAASAKLRQQQKQLQQQQQQQQQLLQQQQQQQHQLNARNQRWNEAYELDDGYVQQNSVLDNHRNRIRIDVGSVGSPSLSSGSGRSSSDSIGTAETWLDDEQFENSLNEELEYRCESVYVR